MRGPAPVPGIHKTRLSGTIGIERDWCGDDGKIRGTKSAQITGKGRKVRMIGESPRRCGVIEISAGFSSVMSKRDMSSTPPSTGDLIGLSGGWFSMVELCEENRKKSATCIQAMRKA